MGGLSVKKKSFRLSLHVFIYNPFKSLKLEEGPALQNHSFPLEILKPEMAYTDCSALRLIF